MIKISHDNYIRAIGMGRTFNIEIDQLPSLFSSYYEESVKAAEMVWTNKSGKLHILYSGGLDSEYLLCLFLALKMDVTVVIIRLCPHYNDHDVDYAFRFCTERNITPLVIDIDFDQFVTSGKMLSISKDIRSHVYHRSATAYAVGLLDGTVLLGEGEPTIEYRNGKWDIVIFEHDYAHVNYFHNNGIIGTPHFNRYTPEMMAAFLTDPAIMGIALGHYGNIGTSDRWKYLVYNRGNDFDLAPRPKYHGYEMIAISKIAKHEDFAEVDRFGSEYRKMYSTDYMNFVDNHIG